ncbi:hypothetical protein DL766_001253 [Monosporascus sp. MC13-8B]|uniref:Ion transport domain-containing protein n=1 Tax=Monosporascus cannonballus TaxID=155416 RepID=A0ABY0H9X0_9PEZI|nr:hypothetical protein DL762_003688 [Monosporascus cannonballus]RYO96965.1 hypothetical protein DL763_003002 [Monosporascus cannonballus]RYP37956.1 hypothetical protein DL766_001253 [Monosporascus sp. MC13-8B]
MPRFSWGKALGWDRRPSHGRRPSASYESHRRLLPSHNHDDVGSVIPPAEVTKTALRLRYLIEECVPCELEEAEVTRPHNRVITKKVVKAAKEAGGPASHACVVFCLLVVKDWFIRQSSTELWDADLHQVRAVACEAIAKGIIETEEDDNYLLHSVLLKRYSTVVDGEPSPPVNVIEKAVDLHALTVIGSAGYQKCISYLWRGWLVQDEDDPTNFVEYKERDNTALLPHLDPDRMRAPIYQNALQMLISIVYLCLYSGAIHSMNPNGDLDFIEILLYIFTFGFIFDELTKLYKAGYHVLGFWNVFNSVLYSLLMVSLALRLVAFSHSWEDNDGATRRLYNELSYSFLSFTAPMFWGRVLLYLDSFRFFGAMLVVLKVMMKESVIFFALLVVVIVGFLQAFIGLDYADDMTGDASLFVIQAMANAIMQSPDFSGFERFSPPFGILLYYLFTFVVMVILLNVLIALYNSAYEDIYQNADNEYLALFSQRTMQFVRAPDENVFIAPFNLVEIFCLVIPFEWWLPKRQYERLNDAVMAVIYSPLLLCAAVFEARKAKHIRANRRRGEDDGDTYEVWEQMAGQVDFEAEGWAAKVADSKSNVEEDPAVLEVRKLREEVDKLRELLEGLSKKLGDKSDGESLI